MVMVPMTLGDTYPPYTTSISTFCVALCIFVIGDRKNFNFDVQVECASYSLRTTMDKPSLIGALSGHVTD